MKAILVDTSLWIDHFRGNNGTLVPHLKNSIVLTHEFVLGELSQGLFKISERNQIFDLLTSLTQLETSTHEEVFNFCQKFKFAGKGIGWIDAHLLNACWKNNVELLTLDKRLRSLVHQMFD